MARKTGLKLSGTSSVSAKLLASNERARNAAGAALYMLGNDVINDSKSKIPVDFGVAKNSGYTTLPVGTGGGGVRVEIGHGGAAKNYIVPLHENMTARHTTGGAKFLERAIHAARGHARATLSKYFSEAFQRNAKAVAIGKTTPGGG